MSKADEILEPYRQDIDALDDQIIALLADRYNIVRKVGQIKAQENISPVQPGRVDEVRQRAAMLGEEAGLDPDFMRRLYTVMIDYAHQVEQAIKERDAD